MIDFPEKFILRMKDMLGEEYGAFEESYNRPYSDCIRVNTLKVSPEEIKSKDGFSLKQVPWTKKGFYMDREKKFYSSHAYYHSGLYYIQEASAMIPALLVDARPHEKVLDICAAPGGKSTELAAQMEGTGLLVSNDISRSRARALVHNIETMGIKNAVVTSAAPEMLEEIYRGFFDRILIDAPCSGEGMFHKERSMMESWKRNGPEYYHSIQKSILSSAAKMLAPSGRLVYSTCTFSPLENEGTVACFLKEHPEFRVLKIERDELLCGCQSIDAGVPKWLSLCEDELDPGVFDSDITSQLENCLRLWPHHLEGEGHFAAVLQKADGEDGTESVNMDASVRSSGRMKELVPFYSFLEKEGIEQDFEPGRLRLSQGYLSYLPEYQSELKGIHVLRNGWFLGEIKKDRFEPSAAFARGLEPEKTKKKMDYTPLSDELRRYLRCETVSVESDSMDGWNLICTEGHPLGWCKISQGKMKNKYPAGWRIK